MIIHDKPLEYYIDRLKNNEYFGMSMFGDGELIGIFDERTGRENAEGTTYTIELRDALRESLRFKDENFIFSIPAVVQTDEVFGPKKLDNYLKANEIDIEGYEKDIWDVASREAKLAPLIQQLRKMNVCLIGNEAFAGKLDFVNKHIPLDYPNCFHQRSRIRKQLLLGSKYQVYLFAAGLPAAIFVQDVCKRISNAFFIDIGSILDGFIGIGAQRGWRAELYADEEKYKEWMQKNLSE